MYAWSQDVVPPDFCKNCLSYGHQCLCISWHLITMNWTMPITQLSEGIQRGFHVSGKKVSLWSSKWFIESTLIIHHCMAKTDWPTDSVE
jgi:hypothetical protein